MRANVAFPLLGLVALSCLLAHSPASAGVGFAQFNVTATLNTATGGGVGLRSPSLCRSSTTQVDAFGARATVVCATGALVDIVPGKTGGPWAPMHGGAYRFITQVTWNGDWMDTIDDSSGNGTITSWRVVKLPTYSYLELTLGW